MGQVKITFCNRAYAEKWYKNLERQNAKHFSLLQEIIAEVEEKDGRDITKQDIFKRSPAIEAYLASTQFDIIPSRGQMLKHNGNGIRHAKFAPSKSIAIVWEKMGDTIYVTFDDHAPIRYHRAISHLRDIKLGNRAFPKRPRVTGRFLRKLRWFWKQRFSKELRGFDPRRRYFE